MNGTDFVKREAITSVLRYCAQGMVCGSLGVIELWGFWREFVYLFFWCILGGGVMVLWRDVERIGDAWITINIMIKVKSFGIEGLYLAMR